MSSTQQLERPTAAEMDPEQLRVAKRAAFSGFMGSTIEYFDLIAFATASALVFSHLFFESMGERGAAIASFATFGLAYVARPVGAVLFGSLGDRHGRAQTLIYTLTLMGAATFLIGCLPTPRTVGIAAPIMLVVLRLAQGISAGGEQAAAMTLASEHAPSDKRALYSGWIMLGIAAGTALGSAAFVPVTAFGQEFLLSWGWRIPFWIIGPLSLFTLYIRRTVGDAPVYQSAEDEASTLSTKDQLIEIFTKHWKAVLRVIFCTLMTLTGSMSTVFSVSYAVDYQQLSAPKMLAIISAMSVAALVCGPPGAALSDRIGRRPVFGVGVLVIGAMFFVFFAAIETRNYLYISLAFFGVMCAANVCNSVQGTLFTEIFPTRVRATGYAVGLQVGLLLVGFAPTLAAAIVQPGHRGWLPVWIMFAIGMCLASAAAWLGRETRGSSLYSQD